jgi:hypothetical protein
MTNEIAQWVCIALSLILNALTICGVYELTRPWRKARK